MRKYLNFVYNISIIFFSNSAFDKIINPLGILTSISKCPVGIFYAIKNHLYLEMNIFECPKSSNRFVNGALKEEVRQLLELDNS